MRQPILSSAQDDDSPMLIDTHCHLADADYDPDRAEVLARAWAAGVARIVVIGASRESAERALGFAADEPRLSVTAGVHPHDASAWTVEARDWLHAMLRRPEVVAVGEGGACAGNALAAP